MCSRSALHGRCAAMNERTGLHQRVPGIYGTRFPTFGASMECRSSLSPCSAVLGARFPWHICKSGCCGLDAPVGSDNTPSQNSHVTVRHTHARAASPRDALRSWRQVQLARGSSCAPHGDCSATAAPAVHARRSADRRRVSSRPRQWLTTPAVQPSDVVTCTSVCSNHTESVGT